jgi:WD40 repeat protein
MNSDAMAARIENLLGSTPPSVAECIPRRPPPPIPDHQILARIGSGGYGEVWLARSVTGALRAVKVVWRCHFSSERPYEREFHGIVQFEPISRLHPGVVNVLHVGRDDGAGCYFYVMELADGIAGSELGISSSSARSQPEIRNPKPETYFPHTLAAELESRTRLPVTDVVSLGVQLAGALGHLHRHGLVHRDVKPSNVIFVHGQPKLADIGLVTGVHEERSFVGTEGFIPPEGPGSERADLFALGRLLYEAVTGKNRSEFPGLPDDLDQWPKSEREGLIELNEVLARACAPEAKKRHGSAAELAGDLNLILAGRSVRRAYRVERQLRRATLVSVAALVLVFATMFSNWWQRRQREFSDAQARREAVLREQTQKSLTRAEAAERESQQQLYTALLEQARATVLTGEHGQRIRALEAVRRAGAISNSAALRGIAVAALALPDLRFDRELPIIPDVLGACLDPAFERIALCRGTGPIEIRCVADQQLLASLPASTNRPAFGGLWSPDGRFLAVTRDHDPAGRVKDVEVWEVAGARRVLLVRDAPWGAISFHPRLPWIMVGRAPDAAATWDLESGREVVRHRLEGQPIVLKFAPDGESFAASYALAQSLVIAVHHSWDGTRRASHLFTNRVTALDWHPNGRWISVPDHGGTVHLMEAQTGETHVLGRHKSNAMVTEFSPDGRYLFSGGWDRELICWDVKAMRRAFTVGLDSYRLQFRADGRQCAIWQVYPDVPEVRMQLHTFERPALHREFAEDLGGHHNFAAFSPDGRWLAASGGERWVVWDRHRAGPGATMKGIIETRVNFAANGELFVNPRDACFRWRVRPGTNAAAPPELERLDLPQPPGLLSVCLLSNSVVFTGTRGSRLATYDQLPSRQSKEPVWARTVAGLNGASPDERWLGMFRPYSPHLYIHRLPGLERVAKLTNEVRISGFEFSPLGDEVAVSSRAGVDFWSTTNWQQTRHLTNFTGLLYSSDARTFWLWTAYRTAGLYAAGTAQPLLPLPPNTLPLALSPDGAHLAVGVDSRRVQVWDLVELRQRLRELGLDWQ